MIANRSCAAFIPLRGGSKGIPGKNIRSLAGKPLAWWTIKAASDCPSIDTVYVATDAGEIASLVEGFHLPKVRVIGRSPETATDTASTESALLEFANAYPEAETLVLIQATSPLLRREDLDAGLAHYRKSGADTLLSVVRQKRFLWKEGADGLATPINYDFARRPRRQEFDGFLVENGAFYVMRRAGLLKHSNRLHGRVALHEMAEESYCEIDEPSDWLFVESLLLKRRAEGEAAGKMVRMVVTDVDGVLTDAGMYYGEQGDELKKFNTRDGFGLRLLREQGIVTGIITSERTKIVERRGAKLRLDFVHQGVTDKIQILTQECRERGIALEEVAYIGDDLNDLECLKAVGLGACPSDAVEAIRSSGVLVLNPPGGGGAVRALADFILKRCVTETSRKGTESA